MEEKLNRLFNECKNELKSIEIFNEDEIGNVDISVSKRNNKRYGCCKQEEPEKSYKTVIKRGRKKIIRYEKFRVHHIEISPWVMELDEEIIKNTIIHELIHCFPYCNNHGEEFKRYAKFINKKLGYNISRVGDKKEDYNKSNVKYFEDETFKYKIFCEKCGQEFYRKRINRNFLSKYRCGKCGNKFNILVLR